MGWGGEKIQHLAGELNLPTSNLNPLLFLFYALEIFNKILYKVLCRFKKKKQLKNSAYFNLLLLLAPISQIQKLSLRHQKMFFKEILFNGSGGTRTLDFLNFGHLVCHHTEGASLS